MTQILIVDDDEPIRQLLGEMLESNDYGCTLAASAAEARECLKEQDFELVISDIKMPGESGLQFIKYILAQYPDTATLMVTVMGEPATAEEALEMGVYGYVIKPFEPNQILISVSNALRRRELERKERSYQKDLEKLVHERTAELLRINKQLRSREAELQVQTKEVQEVNSALRVLLKRRDEDKRELEEKVLFNTKELALPYLEKLKTSGLDGRQMSYVGILESNLNEIISPFSYSLSSRYLNLTPAEIQVANLIKQGKTSKEIAEFLNLSDRTIGFHRANIREKIGIKNREANLRAHLLSLH